MASVCARFGVAFVMGSVALGAAVPAMAGGLESSGYDWQMLFDPAPNTARTSVTYVNVDQDVESAALGGATVSRTPDQWRYFAGVKSDITDDFACLGTVTNPFGSAVERDFLYAAGTMRAQSEELDSRDIGLTCAYGLPVGPGILSALGGVSYQTLGYEADLPVGPGTTAPLELDGDAIGWRAGVAYEVPEIALRVTAIYNAPLDYELDGSFLGAGASADATVPQSFELRGQTGIAEGWLATATIKWTDWSVLQSLEVDTAAAGPIASDFFYRDGLLVSAGLAHRITPKLTLAGSVVYDRGTATPGAGDVLLAGTQSDRYGVTIGALYAPVENLELTGGVSYSQIMGGENRLGESWDRSNVFAASVGIKASF